MITQCAVLLLNGECINIYQVLIFCTNIPAQYRSEIALPFNFMQNRSLHDLLDFKQISGGVKTDHDLIDKFWFAFANLHLLCFKSGVWNRSGGYFERVRLRVALEKRSYDDAILASYLSHTGADAQMACIDLMNQPPTHILTSISTSLSHANSNKWAASDMWLFKYLSRGLTAFKTGLLFWDFWVRLWT
jgi:hypothetical protein